MSIAEETSSPRANLENWLQAFNTKNIDKIVTYYDQDSLYANAGAPMMSGVDQIMPWYKQVFSQIQGQLLFREERLVEGSDLALIVGKYFFKPPEGQEPIDNSAGRVALVYRKADDGKWLLLFDMDNTPPDVNPRDFI